MNGTFVVFEGPDGSGKSCMLDAVEEHLAARGVRTTRVRDPGGTAIGQQIREVLLRPENRSMCVMTELLLYVASRAQLVEERIRPALERGEIVLSDRFFLSTLVYQGVAGVLPAARLEQVVSLGVEGCQPHHTLLLDVPAVVGLARAGQEPDRMEQKGLAFHEQVRERYLAHAREAESGVVHVVDASQPVDAVRREILEIVDAVV